MKEILIVVIVYVLANLIASAGCEMIKSYSSGEKERFEADLRRQHMELLSRE